MDQLEGQVTKPETGASYIASKLIWYKEVCITHCVIVSGIYICITVYKRILVVTSIFDDF